jgi:hypothetical protein
VKNAGVTISWKVPDAPEDVIERDLNCVNRRTRGNFHTMKDVI